MAKVSFTKLGLKVNQDTKTVVFNEQSIEVKQYLPINDKLEMIGNIINQAHDADNNFSNPVKVDMFTVLEMIYAYTNINFTDKQKEDVTKLYDLLASSGLMDQIIEVIPDEEYCSIVQGVSDSIKAIYAYQNSVMGVLDTISTDYSNLSLDATDIHQQISDPENMALLKQVLTKLG